jgi:hypothetical protein
MEEIAMAGTPRDRELEDAQKEIQRRLLRREKLKRIEAEEMRRLAATGWKPPIERTTPTTPTAGPAVQDAADAIEVTEQKRRAFAREAQRRAEAAGEDTTDAAGEAPTDEAPPHHNNWFDSGSGAFNPAEWEWVGGVSYRSPLTFVDGNRIAVQAMSSAGLLWTNQFQWTANAEGLEADGTRQTAVSTEEWLNPVPYSAGLTGGGKPNAFVLKARFEAPQYRWTVAIPPQESAHGNAGPPTLIVYKPRGS